MPGGDYEASNMSQFDSEVRDPDPSGCIALRKK